MKKLTSIHWSDDDDRNRRCQAGFELLLSDFENPHDVQELWLDLRADTEKRTCPKCKGKTKWHRHGERSAWTCGKCNFHISLTKGTPFERTHFSPLQLMRLCYLFTHHAKPTQRMAMWALESTSMKAGYRMLSILRRSLRKHNAYLGERRRFKNPRDKVNAAIDILELLLAKKPLA